MGLLPDQKHNHIHALKCQAERLERAINLVANVDTSGLVLREYAESMLLEAVNLLDNTRELIVEQVVAAQELDPQTLEPL